MHPHGWRRVLVYTHRWLGIAGAVLFVAWFASGIVMMYARMPVLTDADRLSMMPPLDLSTVTVAPAVAALRAGVSPDRVSIGMIGDRPVYRFFDRRGWSTVYADTGERLQGLTAADAVRLVTRVAPGHASSVRHDARLTDADQWSMGRRGLMPMHRVALGDPDQTYLYVSERTGDIVLETTSRERRWAYPGAVVHWLYFTPFRRQTALWTQTIIWTSIAGCLLCLSGLVWGVWRLSPVRGYRLKQTRSISPYAGWMKWHHYAGLIFGVATFTWIFSGLLSMTPWNWSPGTSPTRQQREAVAGGPLRLEAFTLDAMRDAMSRMAASFAPKEIDVVQFGGQAYLGAWRAPSDYRVVSAHPFDRHPFAEFDAAAMLAAARRAMPGVPVEDTAWLEQYDAYYYDRHGTRPLPVLRVRYADPERTWLYLDPRRGAIAMKHERVSRVERWLYHGLHSLDFPFLYYRRPLWDAVVIALSLGGIALSVTTMVPAARRLRRHARRFFGHDQGRKSKAEFRRL